jgi:molecular chaperone HscB
MSVVVANLSASDNYFTFFGLTPRFKLDTTVLDQAYLAIQKEVHPDRHASGTESEQRVAMQMATYANTAYRTLKDPVQRGLYLCQLNGVDAHLETNTAMPVEFLMKQMEWREALDESIENLSELESLASEVHRARDESIVRLTEEFEKSAYQTAVETLRGLLFIEKFAAELDDAIAELV